MKDCVKENIKDNGFIMVLVAFILVVLFTFGTFLLEISRTDFDIGNTQVARVQAYYNAESEINLSLTQLYADEDKLSELTDIINDLDLGGEANLNLSVPIIDEDGTVTWPNPEKYVTFTVSKEDEEVSGIASNIFLSADNTATYSGKYGEAIKNLKVQSKIILDNGWLLPQNSAIVSKGLVELKNKCVVNGDVYGGDINTHEKTVLNGIPCESDSIVFPQLDELQFSDWDSPPSKFIESGDLTTDLSPGNYYSTTPIDFHGYYSGNIVLVFDCDLVLFNNKDEGAIKAADGDFINNFLTVICLGSVEFKNGREFEGVIIAPNEPVVFKNGGTFTGTIISNVSFEGDNGVTITYDNDIANNFNDFIINNFDGDLNFDIHYWK